MEGIRLNKYLSETGVCSRREADRLIDAGKVTVDGKTATMGMKLGTFDTIICNGRIIQFGSGRELIKPVLLLVNKPVGIVCTTSDKDRAKNIVDLVGYPERVYPVGRLDKDSEGLILLTNQGDLVNKMMRSGNAHEKEYLVEADQEVTEEFLNAMSAGVPILGTVTRPCKVEKVGNRQFRIILTQGLNRQIRRMCEYLGYGVVRLKRIRIMNLRLGDLKLGEYREITRGESVCLMELLKESTNLSFRESRNGKKS